MESACRVNNGDCEQVCLEGSVRGHYRCGCREGYQLKSDSRTCECKYTPEQDLVCMLSRTALLKGYTSEPVVFDSVGMKTLFEVEKMA